MRQGTLAVLAAIACGGVNQPASEPAPSLQPSNPRLDSLVHAGVLNAYRYNHEDPALLSALFRRLAQLADTGQGHKFAAFCLSIGAMPPGDSVPDASPQVLEQLRDLPLPVRPTSACKVLPLHAGRMTVIDTATKGPAIALRIVALHREDEKSFTTEMDWYIGPEWAAGWTCRAAKLQEQWRVDKCSMIWVS